MVQISNGIWNPEAQPFEIRTKCCHFFKNHLKSGEKVLILNGQVFQMVGTLALAIAKAWPFENRTIWNPRFKKSGFQMVKFQIPTVLDPKLSLNRPSNNDLPCSNFESALYLDSTIEKIGFRTDTNCCNPLPSSIFLFQQCFKSQVILVIIII